MTFVIFQALSAVLVGGVIFFPGTLNNDGKFTPIGWLLWILGAVLFVTSTIIIQHQANASRIELEHNLKEIRDRLFTQSASRIMETPKVSEVPPTQGPSERVKITEPSEGAKVSGRQTVKGRVQKGYDDVWVIVHPIDTSSYWVQPSISAKKDGKWSITAYFGRSGNIDVGKSFEIMAILNPQKKLKEGEYFDKWPVAESRSDIVTVVRQ